MFCSTIIPTIGRPTLTRAVESVLRQDYPGGDHEVIVVNDSGRPLQMEFWQQSDQVRIISTNRRNRSVARNAGAALARGRFLHFLDDDDWLLPGALQSLRKVADLGHAGWIYGAFRLVDNEGKRIAELHPCHPANCLVQLLTGEWLPLQASLICADAFFISGGFDPRPPLSRGFQDVDLSRQIARHYEFARTPEVVASIRIGDTGSTTDYGNMLKYNRLSREKLLAMPGAFSRLTASAKVSAVDRDYWQARIIYYYLASANQHFRHRGYLMSASRAVFALAGFAAAPSYLFSRAFWMGLSKPHRTEVYWAIMASFPDLFRHTEWKY